MDGVALDLLAFYTQRYDADARLPATPHGRLEYARTRELVERFLPPPPGRVLDVGGGTGIHAEWLADAGCAVRLRARARGDRHRSLRRRFGFTEAYFHTAEELAGELGAAGFAVGRA